MDSKLLQKDVVKILSINEDGIAKWEKTEAFRRYNYAICHRVLRLPAIHFDLTASSGKLKAYRHVKGISQKKLGTMLNVDGATMSSWE